MTRQSILILLAVLGLAGGSYVWWASRHVAPDLRLSGSVDIREVNLSFRVGGRLKQLMVDEGVQVQAGQLLGELDDQPLRIALAEAQSAYEVTVAQAALFSAGYRHEDVEQARATLAAREAALDVAERLLSRQQQLADTGASARHNLDDARSQRDQAAALARAARQQLQSLSSGFRKEEVAQARANAQRSAHMVEQAQLQLADARLVAPADGIILTRAFEPGSMLAAGSTVLTLSLTRPVWVRAYVSEPNLGRVAPGTPVRVRSDSRTQPYQGVVGFVSPTAEFTPKNVETQDLRETLVYRLRVIVQNPDASLRQGMPVTVELDGH